MGESRDFATRGVRISEQNVERMRANVEAFRAGTSESDREAMLTKLAERWDPDIELDASEGRVFDLTGVYRGRDALREGGVGLNVQGRFGRPPEVLHEPVGSSRSGRALGRRPQ
jgi:hypothetical protein